MINMCNVAMCANDNNDIWTISFEGALLFWKYENKTIYYVNMLPKQFRDINNRVDLMCINEGIIVMSKINGGEFLSYDVVKNEFKEVCFKETQGVKFSGLYWNANKSVFVSQDGNYIVEYNHESDEFFCFNCAVCDFNEVIKNEYGMAYVSSQIMIKRAYHTIYNTNKVVKLDIENHTIADVVNIKWCEKIAFTCEYEDGFLVCDVLGNVYYGDEEKKIKDIYIYNELKPNKAMYNWIINSNFNEICFFPCFSGGIQRVTNGKHEIIKNIPTEKNAFDIFGCFPACENKRYYFYFEVNDSTKLYLIDKKESTVKYIEYRNDEDSISKYKYGLEDSVLIEGACCRNLAEWLDYLTDDKRGI